MKFVSRAIVPALVPALALAAMMMLPATSASASHRGGCKSDIETEATVHGTGPGAARQATRAAVAAWKNAVAAKHGWTYASWSRAQDRDVRCDTHRLNGTTECEVEANPCH